MITISLFLKSLLFPLLLLVTPVTPFNSPSSLSWRKFIIDNSNKLHRHFSTNTNDPSDNSITDDSTFNNIYDNYNSNNRRNINDLIAQEATTNIFTLLKQNIYKGNNNNNEIKNSKKNIDAAQIEYFFTMREAEIKHGRIAMLAAFGWPTSELYHYHQFAQLTNTNINIDNGDITDVLSNAFHGDYIQYIQDIVLKMGANGTAPSVLNGGLDNIYALLFLSIFFAIGGILEVNELQRRKALPKEVENFYAMWREDGWDAPGNYNFDPLRLGEFFCPSDIAKVWMQNIEIFNGRLAMLATVGYVVQEYLTKMPVIAETPQFFTSPF